MPARTNEPEREFGEDDETETRTSFADLAEPLPKAPPHVKPGAMLTRVVLAIVMLVLSLVVAFSVRALR